MKKTGLSLVAIILVLLPDTVDAQLSLTAWVNNFLCWFPIFNLFLCDDCVYHDEPCLEGTCDDQIGSFKCVCDPGWTGDLCDEKSACNIQLQTECTVADGSSHAGQNCDEPILFEHCIERPTAALMLFIGGDCKQSDNTQELVYLRGLRIWTSSL